MSKLARQGRVRHQRYAGAGRCCTATISRKAALSRRRLKVATAVTHDFLRLLATCSEIEEQLAELHPHAAERFEVVVDALAARMAREIADLRDGRTP